ALLARHVELVGERRGLQLVGQEAGLVVVVRAADVVVNFLKANDVRALVLDDLDDSLELVAPVVPYALVDVIAEQPHRISVWWGKVYLFKYIALARSRNWNFRRKNRKSPRPPQRLTPVQGR